MTWLFVLLLFIGPFTKGFFFEEEKGLIILVGFFSALLSFKKWLWLILFSNGFCNLFLELTKNGFSHLVLFAFTLFIFISSFWKEKFLFKVKEFLSLLSFWDVLLKITG